MCRPCCVSVNAPSGDTTSVEWPGEYTSVPAKKNIQGPRASIVSAPSLPVVNRPGPGTLRTTDLAGATQVCQAELQRALDKRLSIAEGDAVLLVDEHLHAHVERTASADGEVGSWHEVSRRTVRRRARYERERRDRSAQDQNRKLLHLPLPMSSFAYRSQTPVVLDQTSRSRVVCAPILPPPHKECQASLSREGERHDPLGGPRARGLGRHVSERHLFAGRTRRRTHLCQRPSITGAAHRASFYAPSSLGCSGGSPKRRPRAALGAHMIGESRARHRLSREAPVLLPQLRRGRVRLSRSRSFLRR